LYLTESTDKFDNKVWKLDTKKYKDENIRFARSPMYISNIFKSKSEYPISINQSIELLNTYVNTLLSRDKNDTGESIEIGTALKLTKTKIETISEKEAKQFEVLIDKDLATFEGQRFFTEDPKMNLQQNLPDLLEYMRSPYKRLCNNCGYNLKSTDLDKLKNISKILYEINNFNNTSDTQKFIKLEKLGLALSNLSRGKGINDLKEEGSNLEYADAQKQIIKSMKCPNCEKNTINKTPLYFVESFIFEIVEGLRDGKGTILLGNPETVNNLVTVG
jgi:predicted Zn-ribbon and HTH transcriptional regulator